MFFMRGAAWGLSICVATHISLNLKGFVSIKITYIRFEVVEIRIKKCYIYEWTKSDGDFEFKLKFLLSIYGGN